MSEYRDQLKQDYEDLCAEFAQHMGFGPSDDIELWIKEGLIKYPIVNAAIQGCVFKRSSTATKIKVLKKMIEEHCPL